jgi:glycosyltransferase involved in cell wall biosynthesis
MRVAIIIPRPVNLGPTIVMKALFRSLEGINNLNLDLFCLDLPKKNESELSLPSRKFDRRTFRFDDYDIIHTSGLRPDLIAYLNRKKIRYHISTIHSLVTEEFLLTRNRLFSFIFSNIWLVLWKRADKLVCVSGSVKRYYSEWFSQSKLEIIYNGISESSDSSGPDPDIINIIDHFRNRGLKVIGNAAILSKVKNTQLLLHLVAKRPEFSCVIIGSGRELNNLRKLAFKLGISDRCFFAGFRREAARFFRYFDFFVTASLSEGFGLTIVEAAREKVPLVCSDISTFLELFSSAEVTFFNPGDCDSLSKALDVSSESGKEKTEAAFSVFKAKYTERIMGQKYYELYKTVCKAQTI